MFEVCLTWKGPLEKCRWPPHIAVLIVRLERDTPAHIGSIGAAITGPTNRQTKRNVTWRRKRGRAGDGQIPRTSVRPQTRNEIIVLIICGRPRSQSEALSLSLSLSFSSFWVDFHFQTGLSAQNRLTKLGSLFKADRGIKGIFSTTPTPPPSPKHV